MKRKRIASLAMLGIMTTMLAGQAFADSTPRISSTWNESTITLPRNGWWYTVTRTATDTYQQTRVTNPTYDVVSNIVSASNTSKEFSSNKTHKKGQTDIHKHQTDVKGAELKGAFRSSIINQFTNRVKLAWRV
ncbi:hypothetical protein PIU50_003384 [Clostridioides difficile]|nr:hypothetical protein [Clostridioides difficile]MBZ0632404.1 hypothetical protein [Clostridioides difficile]MBZ0658262.1 hypothetical protein [Clostridioides difficile]HBF9262883.1 hypothetical protein [Clostridioides difficile]HBF9360006.1 hypothetical protein [Clostridioides difficile]